MNEYILGVIRSFATDEQVKSIKIFGCLVCELEKDDVVRLVVHLVKEVERTRLVLSDLNFVASIR